MTTTEATDDAGQNKAHFEHNDEVQSLMSLLLHEDDGKMKEVISRLQDIFDYYQEQSHLLDPFLEQLIHPVVDKLRNDIDSILTTRSQPSKRTIALFRYLYLLTKTRGYKTIVKFMSHEVADLEPLFHFLISIDRQDSQLWEIRYISFIWLSLISMIPFDLAHVDSDLSESKKPLVERMLDLCKDYLRSTGKERDGASLLVARLLSRRDVCGAFLIPYLTWSRERLESNADVFETAGILASVCALYQLAPREIVLPSLDDHIFPVLSMEFFDNYTNNSLIRKLRMKLAQRVGLCYLKPRIAWWRYQRGNRSLRQNLGTTMSITPGQAQASADDSHVDNEDDEADDDVPENLEYIIGALLEGLRDKDTIVRWSAAKGIGRITQRLPQLLASEVIDSLLELFQENTYTRDGVMDLTAVSEHTWHGALLVLAELARRGLLLPDRLVETVPWVVHGLKFDLKRGSHSIGSQVRDAACYVCWSFARAYAANIIEPYVEDIAKNLAVVSVFDREINIRRASSAAFQENVGRQGIFPHGIDIIQLADYFSVGNRQNSYLQVAIEIAKFDEYRYHLIEHLVSITSKHWDKTLRILVSQSLYRMVPLDPVYFIENVLPRLVSLSTSTDLHISHGSLLILGDVSLAIWQCRQTNTSLDTLWNENTLLIEDLGTLISKLPPKSLTTFGSEHIREGACHLIRCLSDIKLLPTLPEAILTAWKKVVHTSLERKEENVQEFAVSAYGAMSQAFGYSDRDLYEDLKKIQPSQMMYRKRGYALALGALTYTQHKHCLGDVLKGLCMAAKFQSDSQMNDAEAKRNAVIGITHIVQGISDTFALYISPDNCSLILDTLEACLTDYSTDQRGDVGSWVRVATMNCLQILLPILAQVDTPLQPDYLAKDRTIRLVGALMKQSVERIDRVRACAGSVLCDLLPISGLDIPEREHLRQNITRELDFSSPASFYSSFVPLLSLEPYRFELLSGLIFSAGGLTETLVRHSGSSLMDYLNQQPQEGRDAIIRVVLKIFEVYERQDRVIMPLLDVLALFYEGDTLSSLPAVLHQSLLMQIRKESFRSRNVKKLLSVIRVYTGMLSLSGTTVKTRALQVLLSYLVHAFPRIRVEASEQLYTYISALSEDEATEGTMNAEDIIMSTDWAAPLEEITVVRDQLYTFLDVPKPVTKQKK